MIKSSLLVRPFKGLIDQIAMDQTIYFSPETMISFAAGIEKIIYSAPERDLTHILSVSTSRLSEGNLMKSERPLGRYTIVGKVFRPNFSVLNSRSTSA